MCATPGNHNAHLETQHATATAIPKSYVAKRKSGRLQNCKEGHMQDSAQRIFWDSTLLSVLENV